MNNVIEKHRNWTIIKNSDGFIALDPEGHNVLPCSHTDAKQARQSIDHFILAKGDIHIFWLLCGQSGWDAVAIDEETIAVNKVSTMKLGKRDNRQYKPSYKYLFTTRVASGVASAELTGTGIFQRVELPLLDAEECLALSNALRRAGKRLLEQQQ